MKNSVILLICPAELRYMPYVKQYADLFEREGIPYDVVYWEKSGGLAQGPDNHIIFHSGLEAGDSKGKKFLSYFRFTRFVKRAIEKGNYQGVVVFTVQEALMLESYVLRNFSGRYVIDIRDYSPSLKLPFAEQRFNRVLEKSALNVVSSNGFARWIPDGVRYVVSHNVLKEDLDKSRISGDIAAIQSVPNP